MSSNSMELGGCFCQQQEESKSGSHLHGYFFRTRALIRRQASTRQMICILLLSLTLLSPMLKFCPGAFLSTEFILNQSLGSSVLWLVGRAWIIFRTIDKSRSVTQKNLSFSLWLKKGWKCCWISQHTGYHYKHKGQ